MFALRHSTSPSARAHTGGVSTSISSASAPGDSSSGTLYQRISDIDDIMDLLALPSSSAAATITGAAEGSAC